MLPILFQMGFVKIYTFGVFILLAFFWGMFLLWRNVKLTSFQEDDIFDGLFISIVGGLFLSRLFFVIANFGEFGFNILKFILVNGYPGMSGFGALIGGLGTFYLFCRSHKIDFLSIIDYSIAPLLVALAVSYIGGFLAGVEIGTKTLLPLAVIYSGFSGLRHLPALYAGLLFFSGAIIAQKILLIIRKQLLPNGFAFYFFVWFYSLTTLLLDKLKEDTLYFWGFRVDVSLSVLFFAVTTGYFIYYFRDNLKQVAQSQKQRVKKYGKKILTPVTGKTQKKTT